MEVPLPNLGVSRVNEVEALITVVVRYPRPWNTPSRFLKTPPPGQEGRRARDPQPASPESHRTNHGQGELGLVSETLGRRGRVEAVGGAGTCLLCGAS